MIAGSPNAILSCILHCRHSIAIVGLIESFLHARAKLQSLVAIFCDLFTKALERFGRAGMIGALCGPGLSMDDSLYMRSIYQKPRFVCALVRAALIVLFSTHI